ncbi:MAG: tetrapyrrole methylase family protein / MazG family protein [Chloroflexota bacterium]|nr:tetrapyrrole methylase family protein / MazG family protein [Chloroflexota bacterium]
MENEATSPLQSLLEVIARLHAPAPDGCPWCLEQTHESLADDLLKEAHEAADAMRRGNSADLRSELGDVLSHVLTNVYLADTAGAFTLDDVIVEVTSKLIRRHPHVFGDEKVSSAEEVARKWDAIKRDERPADASVLAGIPGSLPSLMRAEEMQQRAARVGFDWPDQGGVIEKVHEEIDELRAAAPADQPEELGDVLFSLVNLARHLGVDPELALQRASDKFARRFQAVEATCHSRGKAPDAFSLDELDAMWNAAKTAERESPR